MSEKILEQEIEKVGELIKSAQQELDSANKSKAPQSTITHLEDRIKALSKRTKRFEAALNKYSKKSGKTEEQPKVKKSTAASSGKTEDKPEEEGE